MSTHSALAKESHMAHPDYGTVKHQLLGVMARVGRYATLTGKGEDHWKQ